MPLKRAGRPLPGFHGKHTILLMETDFLLDRINQLAELRNFFGIARDGKGIITVEEHQVPFLVDR